MAKTDGGAVDAYIAKHPPKVQAVLRRVRLTIRKALPDAEEAISYQIPAYKVDGKCVVYFAGWKRHWSMYPVTDEVRVALAGELGPYEISKGTIRFPLDEPVPVRLVGRIVKELRKRAAERAGTKASRTTASRAKV